MGHFLVYAPAHHHKIYSVSGRGSYSLSILDVDHLLTLFIPAKKIIKAALNAQEQAMTLAPFIGMRPAPPDERPKAVR